MSKYCPSTLKANKIKNNKKKTERKVFSPWPPKPPQEPLQFLPRKRVLATLSFSSYTEHGIPPEAKDAVRIGVGEIYEDSFELNFYGPDDMPNPRYESQLRKYKKDLAKYEKELKEWEEWKAKEDAREERAEERRERAEYNRLKAKFESQEYK